MDEALKQALQLGRSYFEKKQFVKAERFLTQVVEQNQGFADVYNMLGVIFHDRGDFAKAQRAFEAALRVNPSYTDAALNLAVVYNDLGRYKEAREVYQQALARSAGPGNLDPFVRGKVANMYADIADVWAAAGRYEEAITDFRRALELGPAFVDVRVKLASAFREKGDKEAALAELDAAVAQNGSYLPARIQRGVTLLSLGRRDEAIAAWREVLERSPGNKQAEMYLRLAGAT